MTAPNATRTESTFRLEYRVRATIPAAPAAVWARLTDARAFPSWNSTVTRLDGEIAAGQRLTLQVAAAPGRTFRPTVVAIEDGRRMVWRDGFAPMFRGTRTFTVTPNPDGTTEFEMREVLGGLMLPLIKRSLPDFRPAFDQYATDLARAAAAP